MKRLINHIRRWNIWRKYSGNSRIHKFLVLIGLRKSPTMWTVFLPEEIGEYYERYYRDAIRYGRQYGKTMLHEEFVKQHLEKEKEND